MVWGNIYGFVASVAMCMQLVTVKKIRSQIPFFLFLSMEFLIAGWVSRGVGGRRAGRERHVCIADPCPRCLV